MKIKVNDNVKILAGKDKGKTGKVLKTFKNEQKVVVEGINISKRHTKPKTNNDKGGISEIEMPIHVSNVKLVKEEKKTSAKKVDETKKATKKTSTEKVDEAKKSTKKASK